MKNISLVEATENEMDKSLEMIRSFYSIDGYPFDRKRAQHNFVEMISTEYLGRFWLIRIDEEIAGYLILTFGYSFEYGGRDAFIDEFYLNEAYRGRGFGQEILKQLDQHAKALGIKAIHLEVENTNQRGQKLYLKSGYRGNDRSLLTKRHK